MADGWWFLFFLVLKGKVCPFVSYREYVASVQYNPLNLKCMQAKKDFLSKKNDDIFLVNIPRMQQVYYFLTLYEHFDV